MKLAAGPGSSICAWSYEQQNKSTADSALKDLGLCQQGAKTHSEIFCVAAMSTIVHGACCFLMTSLTTSPANVRSFPQDQMEERPKASPS